MTGQGSRESGLSEVLEIGDWDSGFWMKTTEVKSHSCHFDQGVHNIYVTSLVMGTFPWLSKYFPGLQGYLQKYLQRYHFPLPYSIIWEQVTMFSPSLRSGGGGIKLHLLDWGVVFGFFYKEEMSLLFILCLFSHLFLPVRIHVYFILGVINECSLRVFRHNPHPLGQMPWSLCEWEPKHARGRSHCEALMKQWLVET